MIYQPVRHAIDEARNNIWRASQQAQAADSTPLHTAFETLRDAVANLTDAMEKLYEAAAVEEQGR